ncbi:MAG: RNA-binding protein [Clostridia bacterium]|nr:RNA-binding protein [Clostridia bacterium]
MDNKLEEKLLIAKAQDTAFLCEKQNCIKATGFLTPSEREIVRKNITKNPVKTCFCGGYEDAERTMFVALPDYLEETDALDLISAIEISGRDVGSLRHPDFLGSLLGLGIKREKIGDIIVLEDRCIVFVAENIGAYIVENLTKVGRHGVKVRLIPNEMLEIPLRKVETMSHTVSALRLDSVVSAATKTSRSIAAGYIAEGRVFVNWMQTENVSLKIKPGDVFSVRGQGRFRLLEEIRETKKGRIGIQIEKFI